MRYFKIKVLDFRLFYSLLDNQRLNQNEMILSENQSKAYQKNKRNNSKMSKAVQNLVKTSNKRASDKFGIS